MVSQFIFEEYRFKELLFELNKDFREPEKGVPLSFEFESNISTMLNEETGTRSARIDLICMIWRSPKENNYPFTIKVSITGFFKADVPMEKEEFDEYCSISGIAALFPFVRNAIANLTSMANVPTLILPLINVVKMFEEKDKEAAAGGDSIGSEVLPEDGKE
jgi:preprotein translocase subunit SecB